MVNISTQSRSILGRFRRAIRRPHELIIRRIKAPRMVWGWRNPSGEWQDKTRISDTVYIEAPKNVYLENGIYVGHYTILDGSGELSIGEGTQISAWVGIFTHSSHIAIRLYGNHYQQIPEDQKVGYLNAAVNIGRYVYIGAGAKILPGITIGDGALIAAGSTVTKDVGEFQIVAGNPATVTGDTRHMDEQFLQDPELLAWYKEWQKAPVIKLSEQSFKERARSQDTFAKAN